MKTIASSFRTHLDQDITAICTCWIITRVDGTVFRFTDADEDVEFEGQTYKSIGAYRRTAIETTSTLSVDNLDIVGTASDLALPESDLRAGLFDNAEIRVFITPWLGGVTGQIKMRRGFFGEVQTLPNGTFQVELRGLMQKLSYTYMDIYSATCLYDLGEPKCGIPIKPTEIQRDTAYSVGDKQSASYDGLLRGQYFPLLIGDPSFEEAGLLGGGFEDSLYWSGNLVIDSLQAYSGNYSAVGTGSIYQDVDLTEAGSGVSIASIDAGACYVTLRCWRYDESDQGNVILEFRDINGSISSVSTGLTDVSANWTEVEFLDVAVPAGARYLRIQFDTNEITSPRADARIDNISGYVIDTSQTVAINSQVQNDIYWECTTAGTTASSAPTFTGNPDDTVVDGTVTWTARNAWTRKGRVVASSDARTFRAVIDDARGVDAWFNGGLVTFESGANTGVSMEVKAWTQAEGEIELFLSLPNNISAGDLFSIYPGCDKSRISCAAIFDNIANFFGVPDVPGQDELLRYPDAQ